jgi:hypothetical protein
MPSQSKHLVEEQPDVESSSDDQFDKVRHIDKMANEIEESMAKKNEYHMQVDRKEAKRNIKSKALVEL